jgi:hypothetical protein
MLNLKGDSDLTKREFSIFVTLVAFTILLGILPSFSNSDGLHYSVSTLIYSYSDPTFALLLSLPVSSMSGLGKKLNPYYITGFADAESTFMIIIDKYPKLSSGYRIQLIYDICLHKKDLALLKLIQLFFNGVGSISKLGKDAYKYRVSSPKDLIVIFEHFNKNSLITQKLAHGRQSGSRRAGACCAGGLLSI